MKTKSNFNYEPIVVVVFFKFVSKSQPNQKYEPKSGKKSTLFNKNRKHHYLIQKAVQQDY